MSLRSPPGPSRTSSSIPGRNFWVGVPSAMTILGERVAPKLPDGCLGRSGVKSQQSGRTTPRRGSNLWEPQDESADAGARGAFSQRAHRHDPVLWAALHRTGVIGGLVAAGVATAGLAWLGARHNGHVPA